jgi:hypothetical protein
MRDEAEHKGDSRAIVGDDGPEVLTTFTKKLVTVA